MLRHKALHQRYSPQYGRKSHPGQAKRSSCIAVSCAVFSFSSAMPAATVPARSRQAYSKQVCLWDLAQIICIAFIIQVAWAI